MPEEKINKILIMPAAGLGDFVMACPMIRQIKNKFPASYLAVLAHHDRGIAELAKFVPYIDEVINFPLKKYRWPSVIEFFMSDFWKLCRQLNKKNFDAAIILAPNPIRTIILKFTAIKKVYSISGKGHPTALALKLASETLGSLPEPVDFGFTMPDVDISGFLPPGTPKPIIGIHPYSAMHFRQWNNYNLLIDKLKAKNCSLVLLGQQKNHTPVPSAIDLVNKLSISELASVISKLDLLVTTDSGPMHIAFAYNIPTLCLFADVPPEIRLPINNPKFHSVIYKKITDGYNVSMTERDVFKQNYFSGITADEVYDKIQVNFKI